ncbi:hypothetical protein CHS0354_037721 [Potamilus streckersoni]|uniref:Uncharacterized protein n=1 Tax=Potamilus streckersoni TaxID=2493646 RepID=A0AAE0T0Z6_9BIVA|nr:hypothetical protein CHS0354_037721 [Potamilus streckersoni]
MESGIGFCCRVDLMEAVMSFSSYTELVITHGPDFIEVDYTPAVSCIVGDDAFCSTGVSIFDVSCPLIDEDEVEVKEVKEDEIKIEGIYHRIYI